ncbi:histidine kinase [Thomasclavelia spiroformis]|nr:histidine kinase [Thomasclavelia spiroformis]
MYNKYKQVILFVINKGGVILEQKYGKLKIFFGYCAGVGKTYAMLNEAQQKSVHGVDVVIGYIEPHDRKETTDLMYGLEQIEKKKIIYKNRVFYEFNLDAALKRHPELILVDELAHTNVHGSRHKKRYSDIEELLRAGINVYTTVNVQHLESLYDIVESITRIKVNERIPDHIFDDADDVKLVDIEIDDLINRLKEGKIYHQKQAQRALENFFIRDNLTALREIALRRCADRINLITAKQNKSFLKEHIMVCLGTSPTNQKVIRTAARMAQAFHADFTALYVETSQSKNMQKKQLNQLQSNLTLARHLKADIVSTYGDNIAYQISQYAKTSNVSKLVLGRSYQKPSLIKKGTIVDQLTKTTPNLEIFIIPDTNSTAQKTHLNFKKLTEFSLRETLITLFILSITTLIAFGLYYFNLNITNIILLYVLASCIIGMTTFYPIYNLIGTFISIILIDIFFIEPRFSLTVASREYPLMLLVMIIVSVSISTMGHRLKKENALASMHSYSMDVLLQISQRLQVAKSYDDIMQETCYQLNKMLNRTIIFYPVKNKELQSPVIYGTNINSKIKSILTSYDELAVAKWVFINNKNAGATTNTLPKAKAWYLAIRKNNIVYAVVGIVIKEDDDLIPYEKTLLKAILNEIVLAIDSIKK